MPLSHVRKNPVLQYINNTEKIKKFNKAKQQILFELLKQQYLGLAKYYNRNPNVKNYYLDMARLVNFNIRPN
jgi:hypothetical protein